MHSRLWTARNVATAGWYGVLRLFGPTPPTDLRCIVGSTVHPWLWCPRIATRDGGGGWSLVCSRHAPEEGQP